MSLRKERRLKAKFEKMSDREKRAYLIKLNRNKQADTIMIESLNGSFIGNRSEWSKVK
jgi:uncharacterized protein YdeI (YjbR/CyaY-like superfamily)